MHRKILHLSKFKLYLALLLTVIVEFIFFKPYSGWSKIGHLGERIAKLISCIHSSAIHNIMNVRIQINLLQIQLNVAVYEPEENLREGQPHYSCLSGLSDPPWKPRRRKRDVGASEHRQAPNHNNCFRKSLIAGSSLFSTPPPPPPPANTSCEPHASSPDQTRTAPRLATAKLATPRPSSPRLATPRHAPCKAHASSPDLVQ